MIKIGDKVKVKPNVNCIWVKSGQEFTVLDTYTCKRTSNRFVKVSETLPYLKESDLEVIKTIKSKVRRQWLIINKNTGVIVGHATFPNHAVSLRNSMEKPHNFMIKPIEVVY